jgi:hypothetical protein
LAVSRSCNQQIAAVLAGALLSYFVSIGDECPKRLKKLLGIGPDTHDCNGVDSNIVKTNLYFVQNLCTVFEAAVLAIEKDDFTFCELCPVMQKLRTKFQSRLNDKYFSAGAQTILGSEDIQPHRRMIEDNFCAALQRALTYLEKWFCFSDSSVASVMGQIALTSIPTFENLTKISTILGLDSDIDKDVLYDELTETRPLLEPLVSHSQSQDASSVSQKWQKYFKSCTECDTTVVPIPTMMFRIVSTALSVPETTLSLSGFLPS